MSWGRSPLYKQISASEIQHLLDEGRTRTEVCKLLDISQMTLRKYVGCDPKRKPYTRKTDQSEAKLVYSTEIASETIKRKDEDLPIQQQKQAESAKIEHKNNGLTRKTYEELIGEHVKITVCSTDGSIRVEFLQQTIDLDALKAMTKEMMRAYTDAQSILGGIQ